jgi:hypothetical protein
MIRDSLLALHEKYFHDLLDYRCQALYHFNQHA